MVLFLIFLLGLVVGSFLNVVIDRLPRGETIFTGRSHCESCHKVLKWYDMVPLLSFVLLRGRCRYCKVKLSYEYPIVELVTGAMFAFVGWWVFRNLPFTIYHLPFYLYIISSFIIIFFIDLKEGIIPDKIVFPAVLITILYQVMSYGFMVHSYLLSGVGSFLLFFALFLGTKGKGMGFGDVKLVFLLGLLLGFPYILIALYLAFLIGAIVGLMLIVIQKKKLKGATIPFGPFLVLGTVIALFCGDELITLSRLVL